MKKELDIASYFAVVIAFATLFMNHFLFYSKSRVDLKHGIRAVSQMKECFWVLFALLAIALIFIIISNITDKKIFYILTAFTCCIAIAALLYFADDTARSFPVQSRTMRISLSIGAYVFILQMYLLIEKAGSHFKNKYIKLLLYVSLVVAIVVLFASGNLDQLSIFKEYRAREMQFVDELIKHIGMVYAVLITSVVIGIPLGWYMTKNSKVERAVSSFLSTVESIPSVAFMFIIMFPLAFINRAVPLAGRLGISGIGATPVFIGLLFYALFYIVNGVYSSIKNIEGKYIEVAKGMGMSSGNIFWKVELPLAFPIILSSIKVASIITISGATLGAFVGFGGLGVFILQGSSGFAIDLILLGAVPILLMIVLVSVTIDIIIGLTNHYLFNKGRMAV